MAAVPPTLLPATREASGRRSLYRHLPSTARAPAGTAHALRPGGMPRREPPQTRLLPGAAADRKAVQHAGSAGSAGPVAYCGRGAGDNRLSSSAAGDGGDGSEGGDALGPPPLHLGAPWAVPAAAAAGAPQCPTVSRGSARRQRQRLNKKMGHKLNL
mmetsp:Transcript_99749/g.282271  ORF Transcript_99749/g.282271 Transcript_99749/m.282271 type:complete len:157 (-) Transcript_99749:112-582(-)